MKILVLLGLVGVTLACGNGGGGGGGSTPQHDASCTFNRGVARVTCTVGSESKTCGVERPSEPNEDKTGGPTPLGEYLLGDMIIHRFGVEWYRLHPLVRGQYWHADFRHPQETRSGFGLHEGTISEGCITVSADSCWSQLRNILNKAKVTRRQVYGGVNNRFNTNTIGKLFVRA